MLRLVLISSCFVALAAAGVAYETGKVAGDSDAQGTHFEGVNVELAGHGSSDSGGDQGSKTYVSGAQLASLAHSSALQAHSAVKSQNTAGSQAAFGAKSSLAQAALGAAATAQAALVGREVIVQSLQLQLHDAQNQLEEEISQYQHTRVAAEAAQEAAEQAQQQTHALTAALTASQGGAAQAAKAAAEAAGAAAAQHSMIQRAKTRLIQIAQELKQALQGLDETKRYAERATHAAHIAQSNAEAAASAVAASASEGGNIHQNEGINLEGGYHH